MAIEHDAIQDGKRHEPKGISTALDKQVYIANGAGTGAWATPSALDSGVVPYGAQLTAQGDGDSAWRQPVWKDLTGNVLARNTGSTAPSFGPFIGNSIEAYHFDVGNRVQFYFHIPHDYALGTDMFLHAHWTHRGTAISGTMTWTYEATYSKGHGQASFIPPISSAISYNTVGITTTPQYQHRVDEVLLTSSVPSASLLDTALIEPDGLIICSFAATSIPTITGGVVNQPFLLTVDIHYQADLEGTLNKEPNFYV